MSLKGTGLRLATDQESLELLQNPVACSGEDWAMLEGALRGLSALEAIDVSDNGALGASGAAGLLEVGGRGVRGSVVNCGREQPAGASRI